VPSAACGRRPTISFFDSPRAPLAVPTVRWESYAGGSWRTLQSRVQRAQGSAAWHAGRCQGFRSGCSAGCGSAAGWGSAVMPELAHICRPRAPPKPSQWGLRGPEIGAPGLERRRRPAPCGAPRPTCHRCLPPSPRRSQEAFSVASCACTACNSRLQIYGTVDLCKNCEGKKEGNLLISYQILPFSPTTPEPTLILLSSHPNYSNTCDFICRTLRGAVGAARSRKPSGFLVHGREAWWIGRLARHRDLHSAGAPPRGIGANQRWGAERGWTD
jgi:hypothetical protein